MVFFEPTDIRKATKPFQRRHRRLLGFASPNVNELIAMATHLGYKGTHKILNIETILKMSLCVLSQVENLIVTMGEQGVLIVRSKNENDVYFEQIGNKMVYKKPNGNDIVARLYPVQRIQNVKSASGAGDCLASGMMLAAMLGKDEGTCLAVGFQAAELALASHDPIPKLFDTSDPCWSSKADFTTLKL